MITGGSLCGATTDVVEGAHVRTGAAGGSSWAGMASGDALSPNTASTIRTALQAGDYEPLEWMVKANQSPSRESSLEPSATDPRTRFAARSLSSRGLLKVPESWEQAQIATDPESLSRSPTLSEYDRWTRWQSQNRGMSYGDAD